MMLSPISFDRYDALLRRLELNQPSWAAVIGLCGERKPWITNSSGSGAAGWSSNADLVADNQPRRSPDSL